MNAKRIIFLILLMGFVIAGCRPSSDVNAPVDADPLTEENQPAEPTDGDTDGSETETKAEVTLVFAVNGYERGRFENIVNQFEEENPAIAVEIITVEEIVGSQGIYGPQGDPTEGMLKLMQGADVVNTYLDQSMYRKGLFLDLAPLLESDPNLNRDDFFPGVLELYTLDGEVWAVPFRSGYGLIFYNKELFDTAGVPYPEIGWTWDDLAAKGQAVTVRTGGKTEVWGISLSNFGHAMMVMNQGVSPTIQNGPIAEPNFEDPEVKAAIEDYVNFYKVDRIAPFEYWDPETGQVTIDGEPNDMGIYGLIDSGKIAMWLEYSDAWQWRKDSGQLKVGVVPMPVNDRTEFTSPVLSYGSVFAISAGTQKREAAWQFLNYMTANIEQMSAQYEQNSLPARRSAAVAFWEKQDKEFADALRFAADHAYFANTNSPVLGNLEMALQQILSGEKNLDTALRDAQTEAEAVVEDLIKALEGGPTSVDPFVVSEPKAPTAGSASINFVVAGGDPNVYREAAKQFQEQNPNIVVKVLEPNYFNMEMFSLAAAVKDADCFQWWGSLTAAEDIALVLSPQPFLDADPEMGQQAFFPATLNQMTYQGQLVGIPHEASVSLMNFNKELFDAANRPYPQPGWTIEDFLETAVAMTSEGDEATKVWGFVGNPYEFGDMIVFAERMGADFFDTESDPPKATFNTPEVLSSMRWFIDLTNEYGVKPVFNISSSPEVYDEATDPWFLRQALIENDRAAVWTGDMFGFVEYSPEGEPLETDTSWIGYVPYPVGVSGGVGFDSVSGMYIMASTQQRQACWEWIKYAVQDPALINFGLPAHIATADSPVLADRYTAERLEVLKGSVANSVRGSDQNIFNSKNGWIGQSFTWMDRAYHQALNGDKVLDQAVKEAQTMADDFAACMVAADDFTNYETADKCAREVDPLWGQPVP